MERLTGKVVVITGGAGGIGASAGRLFAREGAKVLLVDRSAQSLKEIEAQINAETVSSFVADVTDETQTQAYIRAAVEEFGTLDVLLANAGIEGTMKPITDYPSSTFDEVMAVNVRGVWLGIKYAIPFMHKQGGGSIVVTSSTAGIRGAPGLSPYTTSKHAVIGMVKSLALECAPMNIRINTVNPCPVETRMMRSLEQHLPSIEGKSAKERITERIPLGRYAEPEDIARIMLFLASDESSFVTGSVYMADGGSTA